MNNCSQSLAEEFASIPCAKLDNGLIQASVIMPNEYNNFYQGARFERAGFILTLLSNDVNYAGRNFLPKKRNPLAHDHVPGQAEEFRKVIVLDDVRFIKLGNGIFRKTPEQKGEYKFWERYEEERIFPWFTSVGTDFIEFRQEASEEKYGYEYTKKILLIPGKKTLRIEYGFTNTGAETIVSDEYAHNFTAIDEYPIEPGYTIEFGFVPNPYTKPGEKDAISRSGNIYTITGQNVQFERFTGPIPAKDNHVIIRHNSGHAIEIREFFDAVQYDLFTSKIAICPETYVEINLKPGESKSWVREYTILS